MTPETAGNWLSILNTGGTVLVLAAIIVYGARMLPTFLTRWGEHTAALINIKNEIESLKVEIKELRDECKHGG